MPARRLPKRSRVRSYHTHRSPAISILAVRPRWRHFVVIPIFVICAIGIWLRNASGSTAFVAAEHPLAVSAGVDILRRGGNAVDAAIAAVAVAGVTNPVSCGLGGGGFMLVYEAATGDAYTLDYRETAPETATPARFHELGIERLGTGALSIGVPGEPAGLAAAHARFGSLPLATVLAPAIHYAREGFPIEDHLAEGIDRRKEMLRVDTTLRALFLHPDGTPRVAGESLRQPDLAASLEELAARGDASFYRGSIAAAIAATIAAHGGLITPADLAAYRARWRTPVRIEYRGRTVLTMPPPGSGAVIATALQVLAGYDLAALGIGSPTYLHLLAETMKAVFADRATYYGDPDFVDVPLARLLSAAHAREIRGRFSAIRVRRGVQPTPLDGGTSHVSVIDARGNAVSTTTTINTSFGSGIVAAGTGIILNNEMADFNLAPGATNVFGLLGTAANVITPHRRPLSSMSPTVVLLGSRAEIVIGASGGPTIITSILQTILGLIDFDLSPRDAVTAPRIHHQGTPPVLLTEPGIPVAVRRTLAALGHTVHVSPSIGAVSIVRVRGDDAIGVGAPRKGGAAAGITPQTDHAQ